MPRPRILSSYNCKRRNADEKREKDGCAARKVDAKKAKSDQAACKIIMMDDSRDSSAVKKQLRRTRTPVATKEVRSARADRVEDSIKFIRRVPPETKEAVTADRRNSSLSVNLLINTRSNAARPEHLVSDGSVVPVPKVCESKSTSQAVRPGPKFTSPVTPSTSGALMMVTQLAPKDSSLKSARSATKTSSKVARVSSSDLTAQRVPISSAARPVINTGPSTIHPGVSAFTSVAQLVASSTDVLRLVPSSSPHVMHLLADRTLEISQVLPRATKKMPIAPTRPTRSTSDSTVQSTRSKTFANSSRILATSVQLPSQVITGLDNSKFVMVLPVSSKATKVLQNPTIRALQKVENPRERPPVQPVVGVQRQRGELPSNSSRNGKQAIETKGSNQPRDRSHPKRSRLASKTNQNLQRIRDHREASWSEKSKEKTFSAESQKIMIPVSKPPIRKDSPRTRRYVDSSRGKRVRNVSSTSTSVNNGKKNNLERPKNGRLATKTSEKKPRLSISAKMHARLTKALANQPIDTPRNTWQARCIICKESFTDKCEFHRHATLSHPGIRIVFCELCSASFRSNDELGRHRIMYHKVAVPRHRECEKIDRSTKPNKPKTENRGKRPRTRLMGIDERVIVNRKRLTIKNRVNSKPVSENAIPRDKLRSRQARKKITVSSVRTRNWRKLSQSKLVDPRKRKESKATNKSQGSTPTKNKFEKTETKKLIVAIRRLEGVTLEKYMFKLATNPVTDFMAIPSKNESPSIEVKTAATTDATKTSLNTSRANGKLIKQSPVVPGLEKTGKTRVTRNRAREELNLIPNFITHETTNLNVPVIRRRSMRRNAAKISSSDSSDETSDVDGIIVHSSDRAEASTAKRRSKSIEKVVDSAFSSIEVDESARVPEIEKDVSARVREIEKNESAQTSEIVRADPATFLSNCNDEALNSEKRLIFDDPDTDSSYSTRKSAAIYTSSDDNSSSVPMRKFLCGKISISRRSSSSNDAPATKFAKITRSENFSSGWSSSSGERLRAESTTSFNSEESLFVPLRSETSQCWVKSDTLDKDSTRSNDNLKNPVGEPKENSEENEKNREVKNKVIEADQASEERAKEKKDENNERSNDNAEENKRKEKTNGEEKQSEDNSNFEKKQDDESDDEDKKSKESVGDRDKDEWMDDDGECREETSLVDMEAVSTDEDERSIKKSKDGLGKQLEEQNVSTYNESITNSYHIRYNQSKDSNSLENTSFNDNLDKTKKRQREDSGEGENKSEAKTIDLCSVCEELSLLMKKVSNQLDEKTKTEGPIKCPLCRRYFISMFHLELHVATKHLQCPNKPICKKGKSSRIDETSRFTDLDCETVLETEQKSCSGAEPSKSQQTIADRDYVLKQLLSDDSSSEEKIVTRKVSRSNRRRDTSGKSNFPVLKKDTLVEKPKDRLDTKKTIVGYISSFHTCKLCNKKFRRAHDLLIHGFYHEDNAIKHDGNRVEDQPKRVQNVPGADIAKAINSQDASDRRDEIENPSSQKITRGSKRRATSLKASFSIGKEVSSESKKRKVSVFPKTSGEKNSSTPEVRSRETDEGMILPVPSSSTKKPIGTKTDETSSKLPIACNKCNRHFASRSLLNEHLFFLHDDILKETVLTDVLPSRKRDDARLSSRSVGTEKISKSWRCDVCVQSFKLFQVYARHRYFVHADDSMVHVCDNCSKVLSSVTMVNVHICTDVASYNCRTCNETFTSGMSLRLHNTEKHTETRGPHVCVECEKNFLTNGMLERHRKCDHRFIRPYRARRNSPVRMAIADTTNEDVEQFSPQLEKVKKNDSDNDEPKSERMKTRAPVGSRRGRWRACRDKKITKLRNPVVQKLEYRPPGKRKRGRPRKYPKSDEEYRESENEDQEEVEPVEAIAPRQSTIYLDVTEIHQCSLCQLHCVSKSTLRNHMTLIHSVNDEICQLCQKPYTHGKLMRHVIDRHITSEDGSVPELDQPWSIDTNSNETDTEILVKTLGIDRLVSLCEYRRYANKLEHDYYPCLTCNANFRNHELYRYHFLLHHDPICALCNIEFKTGHDAARHKNDVHGSVGRYIWFADRTVLGMSSTKNFPDLTDRVFMKTLITSESLPDQDTNDNTNEDDDDDDDDDDDGLENNDDTENLDYTEILVYEKPNGDTIVNEIVPIRETTRELNADRPRIVQISNLSGQPKMIDETSKIGVTTITRNTRLIKPDDSSTFKDFSTMATSSEEPMGENAFVAYDFAEPDSVCLVIVVTDEDLEKFNIATRHPNIWGLAAQISSTYDHVTPKDVKEMLECYFERQEDFDT